MSRLLGRELTAAEHVLFWGGWAAAALIALGWEGIAVVWRDALTAVGEALTAVGEALMRAGEAVRR